jgi:hypothetical protein
MPVMKTPRTRSLPNLADLIRFEMIVSAMTLKNIANRHSHPFGSLIAIEIIEFELVWPMAG